MELPNATGPAAPPTGERRTFFRFVRDGAAWLLCLSFFCMVPLEFASLEWRRTAEGLWRVESGGEPGVLFFLGWFGWAMVSILGALFFLLLGVTGRFRYERNRGGEPGGRDLAYYFAWVQLMTLAVFIPYYAVLPDGSGGWFDLVTPYLPHVLMVGIALWIFRGRLSFLGFCSLSGGRFLAVLGAVALTYAAVYLFLDPLVTEPVARAFHLELGSWREESISRGISQAAGLGVVSVASQFLLLGVIGPVAEEVVFRGMLMGVLARRTGTVAAVILSALVFALFHADVTFLAPLFVLGLLLGALYAVFRTLWAPILFHIVNNSASVIFDLWQS